jgi:hypothetical protein
MNHTLGSPNYVTIGLSIMAAWVVVSFILGVIIGRCLKIMGQDVPAPMPHPPIPKGWRNADDLDERCTFRHRGKRCTGIAGHTQHVHLLTDDTQVAVRRHENSCPDCKYGEPCEKCLGVVQ